MVSIIILSYNTRDLLRLCLQSVDHHTKSVKKEVIVIDNNSTDGSVEMIKKEFPKFLVLRNSSNEGFARGCNRGARKANGEYLLLLNSDTQLTDDHIKNMLEEFEKDSTVGVVGGKLISSDNTTSESYGKFYTILSVIEMMYGLGKTKMQEFGSTTPVDWVSGGFMMIKKEVFEKLNGFDERFFMYVEDVDLCYRAKKMGLKVLYFPKAIALHKGQGSSTRSFAIIHIYNGTLLYFKKHKSSLEYGLVKALLIVKGIFAIFLGTITRNMYLVSTYKKALRFSA